MTEKEKAKELVDYYADILPLGNNVYKIAKQCSFICVDEILDLDSGYPIDKNYWQDVKSEIEKL